MQVFAQRYPHWIAPLWDPVTARWIHSGILNTYADDGTTRTDITGSVHSAVDDRFTGGAFNGLFIINGIDQPKYWDGNTVTTSPR